MKALSNYFGLTTDNSKPQPAEHQFSVATIYTAFAVVLILYVAFVQWPEHGIPSSLHRYNLELEGGTYWVSSEGLSTGTQVLAWLAFGWKFLMYLCVAVLLHQVSKSFYSKADFTLKALNRLRVIPVVLLIGMIGYSLLTDLTARGIEKSAGLSKLELEPTFISDQGLVTVLFIATLFFIEGALRRGLTLQEDSDGTI
ncbi:hypothetical protein QM007_07100 [Rothia sp. SD9660Na]|uniref:hypothetical protein n=1 Tax=Rothia sp. SD9660Na TaxID=3047030 RepID=UPI0024BA6E54|nr:hypothetical protein [Rothia sp. SD9660Na]WHS49689.1 hypothetical protein QM007_07100 [Rothia sp. SD9660Na]